MLFRSARDHQRFLRTVEYYRCDKPPLRFSHFDRLPVKQKQPIWEAMGERQKGVDILCYCLMPNHFHLLLRQRITTGIRVFLGNVCNSYAKYFNTKYHRNGTLFESVFQARAVESDEELVHVSRYIHLNPVIASLTTINDVGTFPWSSMSFYLGGGNESFVETETVLSAFASAAGYVQYVKDQADYAKRLAKIRHLLIEEGVSS